MVSSLRAGCLLLSHGCRCWFPRGAAWDLSDTVSVEAIASGQDREPGVRVMSSIPLDIQRKCEQRWVARFARPVPPSAPHEHRIQQSAPPGKTKKKTRRTKAAGLRSAPAV